MKQTINLKQLPSTGSAVQPKVDAAIWARIHVRMVDLNSLPGAGNRDTDRFRAGVDRWSVGVIDRGPTPILPAVLQRVVINDFIRPRLDGMPPKKQCCHSHQQSAAAGTNGCPPDRNDLHGGNIV